MILTIPFLFVAGIFLWLWPLIISKGGYYYEKREPLYKAETEILKGHPLAGKVGAFEGAGYVSEGIYRPSIDCRMFTLSLVDFDPVCSRAIGRVIDFYGN